jgi:hypothetical protein
MIISFQMHSTSTKSSSTTTNAWSGCKIKKKKKTTSGRGMAKEKVVCVCCGWAYNRTGGQESPTSKGRGKCIVSKENILQRHFLIEGGL